MKRLGIIIAFVFAASLLVGPSLLAQPLSMGRIEMQGKVVVKGGKGLVFQTPKDSEAPLMNGASIETSGNGKALMDWSSKGSMVLDNNSSATVTEGGFELKQGKLSLRVNPGEVVKVKALGKVYTVKAPANKVGIATIIIENNSVKTAGAIFLGGGGATAAAAGAAPSYLGPALIGGATVAGIAGVAAAANNNGGGGVASPASP